MHSSRMRIGRSLTVCCSLLPGGVSALGASPFGGSAPGVPGLRGVSAPRGVCLVWGVPGPGGLLREGLLQRGWVPGLGDAWSGGAWSRGSAPGGSAPEGVGAWSGGCLVLWTEFLTHACENITLAQLRCGR